MNPQARSSPTRRRFVNRVDELSQLRAWWERPGSLLGLLWGRRRIGKTYLLQEFAAGVRTVFYTARGADPADELAELSRQAQAVLELPYRDLAANPFRDWQEVLETLAESTEEQPLLLIIDEFPELKSVERGIENTLRAFWDRIAGNPQTKLRILLSGSAVRTMEAIQHARSPLYGRFDLKRQLHPFRPHEAALILPGLKASDRALVWGILGGVPSYLAWWDQNRNVRENLLELICSPGGLLLEEGAFVLETEGAGGGLSRQILFAIATGKNRFSEIADVVPGSQGQIANVLRNLEAMLLVERQVPVTEDPRKSQGGRTSYRIQDNFLAFWLNMVARLRGEIDRGLGKGALTTIVEGLNDHMGPRYEEAFRAHLRRLAETGVLGPDVVAVGRFWTKKKEDPGEIDAVVLAGRSRQAVLVGEAKWTPRLNGRLVRHDLELKARALTKKRKDIQYAACARDEVTDPEGLMAVTASELFDS